MVTLGRHSYIASYQESFDPIVEVGNFSSLAGRLTFHGCDNHPINTVSTTPFFYHFPELSLPNTNWTKGKIIIGNDVWIGDDVSILSGVTIGDGAVIGAHSVIAKDCDPFGIYVGNPAELIRHRFTKEIRDSLLKIKWWDWPDEKIIENIQDFYGPAEEFIKKHFYLKRIK